MFNPAQTAAIKAPLGPLRIIAGPGTGKTRTLLGRILALRQQHQIPAPKILALTFTNKAAHELADRLRKNQEPQIRCQTFHALAAYLLRKYANPNFQILNPTQQNSLLQKILTPTEQKQQTAILTDLEILAERPFLPNNPRDLQAKLTESRRQEIWQNYQTALQENQVTDFSQLQTQLLALWQNQPAIQQKCQALFQAILVDEYQDISHLQIELIRKLAQTHQNLTVVGDHNQTIYTWRGARATSLQEFPTLFPAAHTIQLTHNYRNPPAVLQGAQTLIAQNSDQLPQQLFAVQKNNCQIQLWEVPNQQAEIAALQTILQTEIGSLSSMTSADELDRGATTKRSCREIAILYRTQAQGRQLATALTKAGYPLKISSGHHFWHHPEILAFLAELTKLQNSKGLPTKKTFSQFLTEQIEQLDLPYLQKNRLRQLSSFALAFDQLTFSAALTKFLDEAALAQNADNLVPSDALNLLTLHAAKGLEFPIVCLTGLSDGLIPHQKYLTDPTKLAEERRLLYVGLTRAQTELHLILNKETKPSRFLAEIAKDALATRQLPIKTLNQIQRRRRKQAQLKLF